MTPCSSDELHALQFEGIPQGLSLFSLRLGLAFQSLHDGRRWVHEPLRLSVFIEAPQEAIDEVIAANETVRNLVVNEWLHLFRIADDGQVLRRLTEGGWQTAPGG